MSSLICKRCKNNPRVDEKTMCQNCLDAAKVRKKKLYHFRKDNGLCVRCGENPQQEDNLKCPDCTTYSKKYQTNINKEGKSFYQAAIEKGLCRRCRKKPPAQGYSSCDECRQKEKNRRDDLCFRKVCVLCEKPIDRKSKSRQPRYCKSCVRYVKDYAHTRRLKFIEDLRCWMCGNDLDTENEVCSLCLEKKRQYDLNKRNHTNGART